jgi:hypothetical protein
VSVRVFRVPAAVAAGAIHAMEIEAAPCGWWLCCVLQCRPCLLQPECVLPCVLFVVGCVVVAGLCDHAVWCAPPWPAAR